jgi:hypothetical protein
MNKIIKQLAEQADAYAQSEYKKWKPTADFSGVPNIRNIFNAKFAELIVRECLNKIDDVGYKSSNDISADDTELFKDVLKSHFGVKE